MQRFCGTESRHLELRRSPDLLRQPRRGPGAKSWSHVFCDFVPRFIMSELSERTETLPNEECSSSKSVFVGYRQELVRNKKTKYNVNGRDIVIFYHNRNFHAMDQRCYRKYWKSVFTQNLLDSHYSVALVIDRINKTAMGIYWYSR